MYIRAVEKKSKADQKKKKKQSGKEKFETRSLLFIMMVLCANTNINNHAEKTLVVSLILLE